MHVGGSFSATIYATGYGTESLLLSCNWSDNLKIAELTLYLHSRLGQVQNCLKSTLRLTNSSLLAAEVIIRFIRELPKAGSWWTVQLCIVLLKFKVEWHCLELQFLCDNCSTWTRVETVHTYNVQARASGKCLPVLAQKLALFGFYMYLVYARYCTQFQATLVFFSFTTLLQITWFLQFEFWKIAVSVVH